MELMSVDLPSPDSPTTIKVNSNPFLTALRYTWLGRLEEKKRETRRAGYRSHPCRKSIDLQFIGQQECVSSHEDIIEHTWQSRRNPLRVSY